MARMRLEPAKVLAAILFWAGPAWANGSRLGGGGGLDLSLTRIVISLLLCLALAGSLIVLLKRNGGRLNVGMLRGLVAKGLPAEQRIRVIESRRISAHADLCLIRCDDIEYVVLSSAQQQQLLREQPAIRANEA